MGRFLGDERGLVFLGFLVVFYRDKSRIRMASFVGV